MKLNIEFFETTLCMFKLQFLIFNVDEFVAPRKTLEYDLIQDMLTLCLQTHQSTGMEVEEFVKLGSEHIVPICRRTSNSTLTLWIVWLSNAQVTS